MKCSLAISRSFTRSLSFPCLAGLLFGLACSGDGKSEAGGSLSSGAITRPGEEPSFKFYTRDQSGELVFHESGPAVARRLAEARSNSDSESAVGGSVRSKEQELRIEYAYDPGRAVPLKPDDPYFAIYLAAYQCDRASDVSNQTSLATPFTPPSTAAYFEKVLMWHGRKMTTCDELLGLQENMLCTADKLAEAASTVRAISWPHSQIIVPAQAPEDRVVLRDQALLVLSHLASVMHASPQHHEHLEDESGSCTEQYQGLLESPGSVVKTDTYDGRDQFLGGEALARGENDLKNERFARLPTDSRGDVVLPISEQTVLDLVEPRVKHQLHIARAAGRLTKRLVEEQVYDDMAGAERKAQQGGAAVWGLDERGDYDSIRHAFRVLHGRWEALVDDSAANPLHAAKYHAYDPQCAGLPSTRASGDTDVFDSLRTLTARALLKEPRTTAESLALQQALSSGLIMPLAEDASEAAVDEAKDVLIAVLIQRASDAAGGALPSATEAALRENWEALPGSAVRFALEQTALIYAISTDQAIQSPGEVVESPSAPGSEQFEAISSSNSEAFWVLEGGTPASSVDLNPATAFSRPISASACIDSPQMSVIATGLAFRRIAKQLWMADAPAGVQRLARETAVELGSWVGVRNERFTAKAEITSSGASPAVSFSIDAQPKAFGYDTQAELANSLIAFYGSAAEAECFAGSRVECSGLNVSQGLMTDTNGGAFSWDEEGTTYSAYDLRPESGSIHNSTSENEPEDFVWLLVRQKLGITRILGGMKASETPQYLHVSDWRDKLLQGLLSGSLVDVGECSTTLKPKSYGYCLPGIKRDQFVPISNSLSGATGTDSDESWRHYLDLAEEAATRADSLGNSIIEAGEKQDLRREGAQSELGKICGIFPVEGDVADGELGAAGSDLQECGSEPTVDVVFLGEPKSGAALQKVLKDQVCGPDSKVGICAIKDDITALSALSVAGLGFKGAGDDGDPLLAADGGDCDEIIGNFGSALKDSEFNEWLFRQHAQGEEYDVDALVGVANKYQLKVDITGESWLLLKNGSTVMGWVTPPRDGHDPSSVQTGELPSWAPGPFGEFPGCASEELPSEWACHAAPNGCCNPRARALMDQLGVSTAGYTSSEWRRLLKTSLWKLGYLGGAVPGDLIQEPVPAINRNKANLVSVAPQFIYSLGKYTNVGGLDLIHLNGDRRENVPEFKLSAGGNEGWVPEVIGRAVAAAWNYTTDRDEFGSGVRAHLLAAQGTADGLLVHLAGNTPRVYPGVDPQRTLLKFDSYKPLLDQACFAGDEPFIREGELWSELHVSESKEYCEGPLIGDLIQTGSGMDPEFPTVLLRPPECSQMVFNSPPFRMDEECLRGSDWSLSERYVCDPIRHEYDSRCTCQGTFAKSSNQARKILAECTPSQRVSLGVEETSPSGHEDLLIGALSCWGQKGAIMSIGDIPVVSRPEQIEAVSEWIRSKANAIGDDHENMIFLNIPQASVDYRREGSLPFDLIGQGTRTDQIESLDEALGSVSQGLRASRDGFNAMATAIEEANLAIRRANLSAESEQLAIALRKVEIARQMSLGAARVVQGTATLATAMLPSAVGPGDVFSWNPQQTAQTLVNGSSMIAEGTINLTNFAKQNGIVHSSHQLIGEVEDNEIGIAISALNDGIYNAASTIDAAIELVHSGRLGVLSSTSDIAEREREVSYNAAMYSGADFATLPNLSGGEDVVPMPVNTVYRRQYELLDIRYQEALASAKRYAYLARLAMEQRLGVRLSNIRAPLGPIQAPAEWVDDLCSMMGIDYNALRTAATDSDSGTNTSGLNDSEVIEAFADSYVGDYVARLKEVMEFYLLEHPFQDSSDTAVISFREHIEPQNTCRDLPHNLINNSGDLARTGTKDYDGWRVTGCLADSCPSTRPLGEQEVTNTGSNWVKVAPPEPNGGGTVLRIDNSAPPSGPEAQFSRPDYANFWYQRVSLEAGTSYEATWWDQAASISGDTAVQPAPYVFLGVNEEYSPIAIDFYTSTLPTADSAWSSRRRMTFTVAESDDYLIGFQLLEPGAVGIADVQLVEIAASHGGGASYVRTIDGVQQCNAVEARDFKDLFAYDCEGDVCFYELREHFSLREAEILSGSYSESGVPAGNYNYRHGTVALNAVGSGIKDCSSQGAACYSTGFLEYDLLHTALDTPITGQNGERECFSFGQGEIARGKMLATERYISVPLGSADAQLLDGDAFRKPQLKGRPLHGLYSLRVYDRPGLNWNALEDIQLVLEHSYWTAVKPEGF